jgi:hypothetical protein
MRVIILTLHANLLPETGKRQHENESARISPRTPESAKLSEICRRVIGNGSRRSFAGRNATPSRNAAQHRTRNAIYLATLRKWIDRQRTHQAPSAAT